MPAEATRAFLQEWTERVWNSGELALVDQYMTPSYHLHQSDGTEVHGPEQFKQYVLQFRNAFSDLHFTLQDAIAQGERIAWRVTGSGTHDGPLLGIQPTGLAIEVEAVILSTIVDGKWSEDFVIVDALTMLTQLGVIPAPAAVG